MNAVDTPATAASAGPGRSTAGAKLRAAREAAGLSVDAVAQQLKLAPRQVKALEEDDFQHLPGRTFVRGFARNYARFVHLDPDAVLALLPASDAAPALSGAGRPMGEIPVEGIAKPSAARWLAPLFLLAVIAAIAYYELARPQLHSLAQLWSPDSPVTAAAPHAGTQSTSPPARGAVTTALPNPIAESAAPKADVASEPKDGAAVPGSGTSAGAPASPAAVAESAAPSANAPAAVEPAATSGEAALVLTFRGTSWAEVKDAKGRVVLQMTGGAGMTQTVSALPPLELALGNAPEVDVTFRGQALDLAPYTRGNVARVALR